MRKAYFGLNAAILLTFHLLVVLMQVAGWFTYFQTVLYPLLCLVITLMAVVGWKEKDKVKWPGAVVSVVGLGLLIHWVVALVTSIQGNP